MTRPYHRWTPEDIERMHAHPDWTAAELAVALGTTESAVAGARHRFGRFPAKSLEGLCIVCDERPVWLESRYARRMGMCKGCYLRERERRIAETPTEERVRQAASRKNQKN